MQDTAEKLVTFLKRLGADLVFDMKLAEDWSILELQREFTLRSIIDDNGKSKQKTVLSSLCPGEAICVFMVIGLLSQSKNFIRHYMVVVRRNCGFLFNH